VPVGAVTFRNGYGSCGWLDRSSAEPAKRPIDWTIHSTVIGCDLECTVIRITKYFDNLF
jgi:hypothetical protein